jgi:hypothetical protein
MGKVDDMRKQREALYAQRERDARRAPAQSADGASDPQVEVPEEADAALPPADDDARAPRRGAADAEGKCSVCGKVRPLHNGLVAAHQKGLGKVCAGSRKAPR